MIGCRGKIKSQFSKKVCFSRTISRLNVTYMFIVFATSLVVFLFLCYCRYFDETFTTMLLASLLWLYLGNSQVSVYRTIGSTLVQFPVFILLNNLNGCRYFQIIFIFEYIFMVDGIHHTPAKP